MCCRECVNANVNGGASKLPAISDSDVDNSGESPGPQAKRVNHLETPLGQPHATHGLHVWPPLAQHLLVTYAITPSGTPVRWCTFQYHSLTVEPAEFLHRQDAVAYVCTTLCGCVMRGLRL